MSLRKENGESVPEEACVEEMILFSNSDTKLHPMALLAESVEGNIMVTQELPGKGDCQSVEVYETNDVRLDGPVHAVVDRCGFVFILTTNDAKVHLLNPKLNYVRELISLDRHGMEKPSRIHFDNESGILYVQSNVGHESLLGFKITEGRIDPSVWNKDI